MAEHDDGVRCRLSGRFDDDQLPRTVMSSGRSRRSPRPGCQLVVELHTAGWNNIRDSAAWQDVGKDQGSCPALLAPQHNHTVFGKVAFWSVFHCLASN